MHVIMQKTSTLPSAQAILEDEGYSSLEELRTELQTKQAQVKELRGNRKTRVESDIRTMQNTIARYEMAVKVRVDSKLHNIAECCSSIDGLAVTIHLFPGIGSVCCLCYT